ncbi:hypothetical protein HYW83_00820 [Candidatus Peregrinibacteria bacterium]|nr:hypothetical protein [Candidatus Peregrinibacteria bacterium]
MKKMFIGITIGTSILLSGCFGSSEPKAPSEKKIEGFHVYSVEEFSLQVPDEWETLSGASLPGNTPKNTLIAFRSNVKNPRFTANVALIKNDLAQEITPLEYAKMLRQKTVDSLFDFHEILTEQAKIMIAGQEMDTIFFIAEGREATDQDLKRFMQISAVKGKTAYVAAGSFLTEEGEGMAKKLETMMRNFEVK